MCTIPKNGCTQWKRLILKAMGHNSSVYLDEKASHLTVHGGQYKYLPRVLKRRMLDSLEDESTFRVVFSRNPFVRLLSSYLNKLVKANDRHRLRQKLGLDAWSDNLTFADFVSALQRWADAVPGGLALSSGIDHHFALQSSFCGLANDNQSQLHYDWVLKTEEINSWYPCLVDALNLSAVVDSGWPGSKCFFSAPGRPCDGQTWKGGFTGNRWDAPDHRTESLRRLWLHYDRELERRVAKLYAADFALFGYPTRLGLPGDGASAQPRGDGMDGGRRTAG